MTIMAWLTALSSLACIPALFQPWPAAQYWPWMIGISVLGSSGLYVGLLAIRAADLSVLAPFDYSRLIMAVGFGVVLFGEVPDASTLIGATVITLACATATMTARPAGMARARRR